MVFQAVRLRLRRGDLWSWRRWRFLLRRLTRGLKAHWLARQAQRAAYFGFRLDPYTAWRRQNRCSPAARRALQASLPAWTSAPLLSVVMPVYNADPQWLEQAVGSVRAQFYPHWQLCMVDDGSDRLETLACLRALEGTPGIEIRYRAENGHISRATNEALAMADGEFVLFMDQDDVLAPEALLEVANRLRVDGDLDLIYSDEDKIDAAGRHYGPLFKPDWSPSLLSAFNYLNHLTALRRSLVGAVGGLRPGLEGAQDYDLLLRLLPRLSVQPGRVAHIPQVLYHWRGISGSSAADARDKPEMGRAAQRALEEAWSGAQGGSAGEGDPGDPKVSLVRPGFARDLGVPLYRPLYRAPQPAPPGWLLGGGPDRPSHWPSCWPWAGCLSREALLEASQGGDGWLVLADPALEPAADWLAALLPWLEVDGVGALGARVVDPKGRLLHAGWSFCDGQWRGAFAGVGQAEPGYFFQAGCTREVLAPGPGLLVTRREDLLAWMDEAGEAGVGWTWTAAYAAWLAGRRQRCLVVAGLDLSAPEGWRMDGPEGPTQRHDPACNPNLLPEGSGAIQSTAVADPSPFLKRPLRVVFYTHNLNPEGAPKVLRDLALGLTRRGSVQSWVVSAEDGALRGELEAAGVPCRVLSPVGSDNIQSGWLRAEDLERTITALEAVLKELDAEVLFANILHSFFALEAAARRGIPALWMIHESYHPHQVAALIDPFAKRYLRGAFLRANRVLFVSRCTRARFEPFDACRNAQVIPNALEPGFAHGQAHPSLRQELGLGEDETLLLSVGTLSPRKDQETLVRALARMDPIPACALVGARPGDAWTEKIATLVRELGLQERVHLVPETTQVEPWYRAADVLVFTSRLESWSLVILEAMASGLPIVSTRACGVAEQVRFGDNAEAVPFGDPLALAKTLERLLADPVRMAAMGRASRARFEALPGVEAMLQAHEQAIVQAWRAGPLEAPV